MFMPDTFGTPALRLQAREDNPAFYDTARLINLNDCRNNRLLVVAYGTNICPY